jgi:SSS family solute:Na+ symporter
MTGPSQSPSPIPRFPYRGFLTRTPFVFLGGLVALLSCGAHAQSDSAAAGFALRGGLGAVDWSVVLLYLAGMIGIGVYYSYRAKTTEEYYLGGRKMRPFMVGLSLFATLISTISYLAVPGEVIKHGPVVVLYIFSLPVIFLLVGYVIIPYIMKLPITSAYEILEVKFGRGVRIFGSSIFLLIRLVWMGLVVFSAAKVVVPCIGWSPGVLPYVVIIVGAVTVAYASMGGLRAVVLTDVVQAFILFVGALACVVIVTVKMGGVGWIPTRWSPNWDVQPFFSLDPTVRVTLVGTLVQTTVWWICTAGSDQMAIQRYLATRDAKAARRAFLVNNVADALVEILLAALGFALLAFFLAHPEYQVGELNLQKDADYLFPHFVVNFVGYGLAGLVISGMLAAAMSSLASGVTSTATVINTDLVSYFLPKDLSEKNKVRLGKWTTAFIGVVVIALGLVMEKVPGNLFEVTNKTNGLFVAPLFGLFFMAMCVRFATAFGTVFGSLYGLLAAFLVAFWDLTGAPAISFQWILAASLLVNIVVGCLLSLIPIRGKGRAYRWGLGILFAIPLIVITYLFCRACMT